jgi:hypothetical protein
MPRHPLHISAGCSGVLSADPAAVAAATAAALRLASSRAYAWTGAAPRWYSAAAHFCTEPSNELCLQRPLAALQSRQKHTLRHVQNAAGMHLLMALTLEFVQTCLRLGPACNEVGMMPGLNGSANCRSLKIAASRGRTTGTTQDPKQSIVHSHGHAASPKHITAPEVTRDRQTILWADSVGTVRLRLRRRHLHGPLCASISWIRLDPRSLRKAACMQLPAP